MSKNAILGKVFQVKILREPKKAKLSSRLDLFTLSRSCNNVTNIPSDPFKESKKGYFKDNSNFTRDCMVKHWFDFPFIHILKKSQSS